MQGDIIGLRLPGNQAMVILNSPKAAFDLLDKRSNIYSDRPKSLVIELYARVSCHGINQFTFECGFCMTPSLEWDGVGTPH